MSANRQPEVPPRGNPPAPSAGPTREQATSWDQTPPTRAEIAAELADHLALASDELERAEGTRARAEARARGAFGSVTWTLWHCWWIGHREEAMFRGVLVVLLAVIGSALGAVAYQGWQTQRVMADQLAAVTTDLGELARQQTDWIKSQQDPARHEIRGRLFRGDPSRPAADVEITVRQLPSLVVVRRLRTDAAGTFRTGRLQAGDYCVLAPLVGEVKNPYVASSEKNFPGASVLHPFYGVQSRPLAVPGDGLDVELDVNMQVGTVELAMDDPVPAAVGPEGAISLVLHFSLVPLDLLALPWRFEDELPGAWPQRGFLTGPANWWNLRTRYFSEQPAPWSIDLGKRFVTDRGSLLAGRYWFQAWCGVSLDRLTGGSFGGGFGNQGTGVKPLPSTPETERLRQLFQSKGQANGIFSPERPLLPGEAPPDATVISVPPGGRLRLKLTPPGDDYLARLDQILAAPDPSDEDVIRFKQAEFLAVTVEELPAETP